MRRGIKAVLVAAVVGGCLLATGAVAVAAPSNDDFAGRTELAGPLPIEVSESNAGATREAGETPETVGAFAAGHSIWFKWTAPESRYYSVGACDSEILAVLGVFTGPAMGSLTRVAAGNAAEGPRCPLSGSEYTFKASAGTEYAIGLDGNSFYLPEWPPPVTEGTLKLRIEATPVPANDDFAAATPIEGTIGEEPGGRRFYTEQLSGFNWNATKETGEPDHAGDPGGASVWYRWTAPESGIARISVCCSLRTLLGVYSGEAVGALSPVAADFERVEFAAVAGATYRIAVDGKRDAGSGEPAMGDFMFSIWMPSLPSMAPAPLTEAGPDGSPPATPGAARLPLEVTITKTRVHARARSVTVWFAGSEAGASFSCRLNGRKWAACRSPKTYRGVSRGRHSIEVRGVSAAGNEDAIAAMQFTLPAAKHRHR
jgi:hypothetical protein